MIERLEFIKTMGEYVAYLQRYYAMYRDKDRVIYFMYADKLEAARDICTMFHCTAEVWAEAETLTNSGRYKEERYETYSGS